MDLVWFEETMDYLVQKTFRGIVFFMVMICALAAVACLAIVSGNISVPGNPATAIVAAIFGLLCLTAAGGLTYWWYGIYNRP
jgi:hypothetical protein